MARSRPLRGATRREAGDPLQGAAVRRDGYRGPGPGPRGLAERKPRRPGVAAFRRNADLYAGRRRGRHDMGVTHIIRGDDHLTNAARQKQIYDALGWNVPIMAHIPLIHGPDGSKLSK